MQDGKEVIKFISTIKGLEHIDLISPKPSTKYIPTWWKDMTTVNGYSSADDGKINVGNVKNCPSFPDYFSNGFTVPMWCDTKLIYRKETDEFSWLVSNQQFFWEVHLHNQFLNLAPYKYLGKNGKFVFKALSPWKVITPPGWSVLQLPMFYHFDNKFTVLPGIIDSDIHHEINQQVMILEENEEIFIPAGTPFVQYIPFKRESLSLEVKSPNEQESEQLERQRLRFWTKFAGSRQYNAMRRERDKGSEI